jgi:hypothetical protein
MVYCITLNKCFQCGGPGHVCQGAKGSNHFIEGEEDELNERPAPIDSGEENEVLDPVRNIRNC